MSDMKLGLQMWSIFDVCVDKGMEYAIKGLKEAGYEGIEFAMGNMPTMEKLTGLPPSELLKILKDYEVTPIGHHIKQHHLLESPEAVLEEALALGEEYCAAFPIFYGDRATKKEQIALYEQFCKVSQIFKDNNIKLVVHGSGFGYLKDYKNRIVLEGMLEEANLDPEFDTCWMILGNVDPVEYIHKYSGRVELLHLKDFKLPFEKSDYLIVQQNSIENRYLECCTAVGEDGALDLPAVVKAAGECGTKWLITELWNEPDSLNVAKRSAENIRRCMNS